MPIKKLPPLDGAESLDAPGAVADAFNDLIPDPATAAGLFDDLVPAPPPEAPPGFPFRPKNEFAGKFDDLIPADQPESLLARILRENPSLKLDEARKVALQRARDMIPEDVSTGGALALELKERANMFPSRLLQIVPDLVKTAGVAGTKLSQLAGAPPEARDIRKDPLYKAGQVLEQGIADTFPTPENPDLGANVVGGAGQIASMIFPGAALNLGPKARTVVALTGGGIQEFQDAFQRSLERGDDPDTAFAKSLGYASVASLIEARFGVGRILKQYFPSPDEAVKVLSGLGLSRELIGNFIAGGVEEGTQRLAQNWIVDGQPSMEGVMDEALPGAIVQGLVSGPGTATPFVQQQAEQNAWARLLQDSGRRMALEASVPDGAAAVRPVLQLAETKPEAAGLFDDLIPPANVPKTGEDSTASQPSETPLASTGNSEGAGGLPGAETATPADPQAARPVPDSGTKEEQVRAGLAALPGAEQDLTGSGTVAETDQQKAETGAIAERNKPKPLATVADVLGAKVDALNQLEAELRKQEGQGNAPQTPTANVAGPVDPLAAALAGAADKPQLAAQRERFAAFSQRIQSGDEAALTEAQTALAKGEISDDHFQALQEAAASAKQPTNRLATKVAGAERGENTVLDALQEHGALGGPELESAMRQMDGGRSAADIAADYGGEYDALANILETIHEARRSRKNNNQANLLKRAYNRARLGGNVKGVDTVLSGMQDAQRAGRGVPGGLPADTNDLIARAWDEAVRHEEGKGRRAEVSPAERQLEQDAAFAEESAQPGTQRQAVVADELQPGDRVKIKGAALQVQRVDRNADSGEVESVQFSNGDRYGTQSVEGTRVLQIDKGSWSGEGQRRHETRTTTAEADRTKAGERALARLQAQRPDWRGLRISNAPAGWDVHTTQGRAGGDGVRQSLDSTLRELIEKAFGVRIHFLESSDGSLVPFNGLHLPGTRDVFIARDASRPVLAVIFHEIGETMRTTHPALYRELVDALTPLMQDFPEYAGKIGAAQRKLGRELTDFDARAELVNDFLGDMATKPEFWDRLAAENPSVFKRTARIVLQWLDRAMEKLRGLGITSFNRERYFSDIEQARNVVHEALQRFVAEGQGNVEKGAERFSARDEFAFDAPESVAEQNARQQREAKARADADKLADRKAYVARGGDRLTGSDLDTTGEMFGGETRVDKAGQGSLFEGGESESSAANRLEQWIKRQADKYQGTPGGLDAKLKRVSEDIRRGELPADLREIAMRKLKPTRDVETGETLDWTDDDFPRTGTLINFLESQSLDRMPHGELSEGEKQAQRGYVPPRFQMAKPIVGPTGAKIVGYEWRSTMGEKWSNREGGYVDARVSDWDNADKSTGTGRDIVHVFYVEHPGGTVRPEGIRSAQNVLGINESRLMTIAKKERAAQQYREQQERADVEAFTKVAKPSPAEAARDYRQKNYSPMRSFEENDAIFRQSVLFEKDGKFVRRGPNATDRMERAGWTRVANDPAKPLTIDNPAVKAVSSAYGVAPETTAEILEKGKSDPYQGELDLSALPTQSERPRRAGDADSLGTFRAEDFRRDFAERSKVSSIEQSKAPATVPQYNVNGTVIRSAADFVNTLLALRSPNNESLKVVILEKLTGKVVHSEVMSAGTLDTLSVDTRDFIRLHEKHGNKGTDMLISHNHPSGDPTPSTADRNFTSRLQLAAKAAGFEVIDHIITNGETYYSLRTDRVESVNNPRLAAWEKMERSRLRIVADSGTFEDLIKNLRQTNDRVAHIIYLNTRQRVTAIERVAPEQAAIQTALMRGIGTEAAAQVLIDYGPRVERGNAYEWTRQINRSLTATTTKVLDFAAQGVMSGRAEGLVTASGGFLSETQGDTLRETADHPERADAGVWAAFRSAETRLKLMRLEQERTAAMQAAQTSGDWQKVKDLNGQMDDIINAPDQKSSRVNVDVPRSKEETAALIEDTVNVLNSAQDAISNFKAKSQPIPADLTQLRNNLTARLKLLKGWADDAAELAAVGQRAATTAPAGSTTRQRQMELEAATDPQQRTWGEWWASVKQGLRYLTSPIPELPLTGERAEKSALFRRGYRLFATENTRVKAEAAAKVQRVLEPLTKLGRTAEANQALRDYYQLGTRLARLRAAGETARADAVAKRMAEIEEQSLNKDPFNLFRRLVLYRDLWWRGTFLKNEQGKPITLPNGLTVDEVAAELRRITKAIEQHPNGMAIVEAAKRHYELTEELQQSILAHGEIIPEALRNPLYFPHHIIDSWSGRLDRVKPTTEEDFRKYLIAPVGSGRLIQSDYLKAMFLHTADVLAHNARVDLVEKYWKPYDISDRLKAEHGEAWNKPWNLPPGYRLFTPYTKLPLRMDYILSREVLADKLGVLFNDGDLRARMGDAGKVLKVKPEDLHAALVAGEKIQWALPVEIADALDGIAKREKAMANPGLGHTIGLPVRKAIGFWKMTKLFAPWNWIRYEYGNLSTDAIDKVLAADPGAAKYLARAAREVWQADQPGEKSPEFKAASREGVFDTITAGEAGDLAKLPEFQEFLTAGEKRWENVKQFLARPMRGSKFREATFRYAKFLADVERLRAGQEPVYAGAFHGDIEALGDTPEGQRKMLEGDELVFAKAAEISLKTYGDYNSLGVAGQWLRQYAIPFWSWQDVNFRYHANQLRNLADGLMGIRGGTPHSAALRYAGVRVLSTLLAVGIAKELWNQFGGPALGLWDDDDDLEAKLSAQDRRRGHLLLGKDRHGQALVVYTPSAWSDVAEWMGGQNMKRLFLEWARGQITLEQFISDYAKLLPADVVNKLAQSGGPALRAPYELASGKATFPDILDQRNIPAADRWWRLVGNLTDDRAANWLRGVFDRDYYSQPASEQLQQIILQVRRRDADQWAYYEAREAAADWKERQTGKRFEQGDYQAPEAMALRNFRKAIYRGDVSAAVRFYERLLEYGYTAPRLDASIRNQAPLSHLSADERTRYLATLDAQGKEQLKRAEAYYGRIKALDGREKSLFPGKGQPAVPNPRLLEQIVESQSRNK